MYGVPGVIGWLRLGLKRIGDFQLRYTHILILSFGMNQLLFVEMDDLDYFKIFTNIFKFDCDSIVMVTPCCCKHFAQCHKHSAVPGILGVVFRSMFLHVFAGTGESAA